MQRKAESFPAENQIYSVGWACKLHSHFQPVVVRGRLPPRPAESLALTHSLSSPCYTTHTLLALLPCRSLGRTARQRWCWACRTTPRSISGHSEPSSLSFTPDMSSSRCRHKTNTLCTQDSAPHHKPKQHRRGSHRIRPLPGVHP